MPIKVYTHKLSAGRRLTNPELRNIMDILDCYKVACDKETFTYYFFEEEKDIPAK